MPSAASLAQLPVPGSVPGVSCWLSVPGPRASGLSWVPEAGAEPLVSPAAAAPSMGLPGVASHPPAPPALGRSPTSSSSLSPGLTSAAFSF